MAPFSGPEGLHLALQTSLRKPVSGPGLGSLADHHFLWVVQSSCATGPSLCFTLEQQQIAPCLHQMSDTTGHSQVKVAHVSTAESRLAMSDQISL